MHPDEYRRMFALEATHWWYVGLRELLRTSLADLPNSGPGRLLDAGCGTGIVLESLSCTRLAFGIDLSPSALGFCRRRKLRNLLRSSVVDLPCGDGQLDCLFSLDVLYHRWVENDRAAFAESFRVLKSGGRMVLHLPAYPFLTSSHDRAICTVRRYTLKEVRKRVVAAGFRIQKITYRNTLLFPALFALRLLRKVFSTGRSDLRPLSPGLNALCLTFSRLENRLIARRIRLPFGSSIFCLAAKP